MKLKEALKRVVKMCPKTKDQALFRTVRFIAGSPSSVFTSDGVSMIWIPVDEPLPSALVSADLISRAIKDKGDLNFCNPGTGNYELRSPMATYQLSLVSDTEFFPSPPPLPPEFHPISDWSLVQKVMHAAASEKEGPKLSVIRFKPTFVEAFDMIRLSRLEFSAPWAGLVPVKIFASWPKGAVEAAFTEYHAFFRVGEEIRIANFSTAEYPNTDKLVSTKHDFRMVWLTLPTFQTVVERATEVSPINLVMLSFDETRLDVKACDASGPMDVFSGGVDLLSSSRFDERKDVTVDGKFLQQALKQVDTPAVQLSFGDVVDPLIIESGPLTEFIWQRYWDN
jgi:hypothetical protein